VILGLGISDTMAKKKQKKKKKKKKKTNKQTNKQKKKNISMNHYICTIFHAENNLSNFAYFIGPILTLRGPATFHRRMECMLTRNLVNIVNGKQKPALRIKILSTENYNYLSVE
jgi:hypothetical protein